jgi:hypothetical protein
MRRFGPALALAASLIAGAVRADPDLFGRDTVQGLVQVQAGASDGLTSESQGGFGKGLLGRGGTVLATGEAVWSPQLTDSTSLVADVVAQPRVGPVVGLGEGYILYRPVPTSSLRIQARAGLLYVPVSMEHDAAPGEPWSVQDTITPSAIDSWIGEEVKVLGAEGQVKQTLQGFTFGVTGGVFGYNDTAGTLLAIRGWSFSNLVGAADSRLALPPRSDYVTLVQDDRTAPTASFDSHLGGYVRVDFKTPSGAGANIVYYDNDAEVGAGYDGQWAWRTRFVDIGAFYPLSTAMTLSGQLMDGRTQARLGSPTGYPFDVSFRAAYVKLVRTQAAETWTARFDAFATSSAHPTPGQLDYHPGPLDPDETYAETGWAVLAAWKHQLSSSQSLLFEFLHVNWRRDYLADFGQAPHQASSTVQVAWRHAF